MVSIGYGDSRDRRWARTWRRARLAVAAAILRATPGHPRRDSAFAEQRPGAQAASLAFSSLAGAPVAPHAAFSGGVRTTARASESGPRWTEVGLSVALELRAPSARTTRPRGRAQARGSKTWGINAGPTATSTTSPTWCRSTRARPASARGTLDEVNVVDRGAGRLFGCEGDGRLQQIAWRTDDDALRRGRHAVQQRRQVVEQAARTVSYDYRSVATHEFGHMLGPRRPARQPEPDHVLPREHQPAPRPAA